MSTQSVIPDSPTAFAAHLRMLRQRADTKMSEGIQKLLAGQTQVTVTPQQFGAAMPPAYPWSPCQPSEVDRVARAAGIVIDWKDAAITLRRGGVASTTTTPAPAPSPTPGAWVHPTTARLMRAAALAPTPPPVIAAPAPPPEPSPEDISAGAVRIKTLLLKHCKVDLGITRCVEIQLVRHHKRLPTDPEMRAQMVTHLSQVLIAEAVAHGETRPELAAAIATISKGYGA